MDYDLERELNELRFLIQNLSSESLKLTSDLSTVNRVQGQSKTAVSTNTTAQNNNSKESTKLQQIMGEVDTKNNQFKANIDVAFDHSVTMLTSLGSALVSSQTGLQKYTQTFESLASGEYEYQSR